MEEVHNTTFNATLEPDRFPNLHAPATPTGDSSPSRYALGTFLHEQITRDGVRVVLWVLRANFPKDSRKGNLRLKGSMCPLLEHTRKRKTKVTSCVKTAAHGWRRTKVYMARKQPKNGCCGEPLYQYQLIDRSHPKWLKVHVFFHDDDDSESGREEVQTDSFSQEVMHSPTLTGDGSSFSLEQLPPFDPDASMVDLYDSIVPKRAQVFGAHAHARIQAGHCVMIFMNVLMQEGKICSCFVHSTESRKRSYRCAVPVSDGGAVQWHNTEAKIMSPKTSAAACCESDLYYFRRANDQVGAHHYERWQQVHVASTEEQLNHALVYPPLLDSNGHIDAVHSPILRVDGDEIPGWSAEMPFDLGDSFNSNLSDDLLNLFDGMAVVKDSDREMVPQSAQPRDTQDSQTSRTAVAALKAFYQSAHFLSEMVEPSVAVMSAVSNENTVIVLSEFALQLMNQSGWCEVLGESGYGKTVVCKWMARHLMGSDVAENNAVVPIYVPLSPGDWPQQPRQTMLETFPLLDQWLSEYWRVCGLDEIARQGLLSLLNRLELCHHKLMFIFDGGHGPQEEKLLQMWLPNLHPLLTLVVVSGLTDMARILEQPGLCCRLIGFRDKVLQLEAIRLFTMEIGLAEPRRVLEWVESFGVAMLQDLFASPRLLRLLCVAFAEHTLLQCRKGPQRRGFHTVADLIAWLVSAVVDSEYAILELSALALHYLSDTALPRDTVICTWMVSCGFLRYQKLNESEWTSPVWALYFAAVYVSNHISDRLCLDRWLHEFPWDEQQLLWRLVAGILRQRDIRTDRGAQLFSEMLLERAAK